MANTKLTKNEKVMFKEMKVDYPFVKFADNGENLVCAYSEHFDTVRFAFAITSPAEQKFRLKVGQFLAMQRVLPEWDNEAAILPIDSFPYMLDALDMVNYS